jgi:hypothetical protein
LLCIVDSMRSKRLYHLSVSGCLQMTLTGLTPLFMLLHGRVVWKDVKILVKPKWQKPKSLLVQLPSLDESSYRSRRGARRDKIPQPISIWTVRSFSAPKENRADSSGAWRQNALVDDKIDVNTNPTRINPD